MLNTTIALLFVAQIEIKEIKIKTVFFIYSFCASSFLNFLNYSNQELYQLKPIQFLKFFSQRSLN